MAKILKEKGFNDLLLGQKLCKQCMTEQEKINKPPENENTTEIIETESSQDELVSDNDFLQYESPKKKLNAILKSIIVSPVNIQGVALHNCASNATGKLQKVLNAYKENISAAYVSVKVKQWPKIQLIMFMLYMMMNTADTFPQKKIMQACRKVFTNKSTKAISFVQST